MLKKIVKYGNSSALILDKALLELLNMTVGSVVKIKTDGTSLIITPQEALVDGQVSESLSIEDTLQEIVKNRNLERFGGDLKKGELFWKELQELYSNTSGKKELNEGILNISKKYLPSDSIPGLSTMDEMGEEFTKVHTKYKHVMLEIHKLQENPDYIHEMALLTEKYKNSDGGLKSQDYLEAYNQIISKRLPEYATYQNELKKVGEKYAPGQKK